MARFVLLEFDDNEAADKLVAKIHAATEAGKGFRVAGIYGRPTRWCTCPIQTAGIKREFIRGEKMGWWMCTACKKPRPGTHKLRNIMTPPTKPWHYSRLDPWIPDVKGYDYLVTGIEIAEIPF